MKVYITRYALTSGIMERNGTVCTEVSARMIDCGGSQYFHKPYWHETRAEAVKHAQSLRDRKIKSFEKQLERLRGLTFADAR